MQDELEDHQEDYHDLTHEDLCDLLSKIEVKDNMKMAITQIKKIASSRSAYLSDSDRSVRTPRKKKSILGASVLQSNKGYHGKATEQHSTQRHFLLCKKAGIP